MTNEQWRRKAKTRDAKIAARKKNADRFYGELKAMEYRILKLTDAAQRSPLRPEHDARVVLDESQRRWLGDAARLLRRARDAR